PPSGVRTNDFCHSDDICHYTKLKKGMQMNNSFPGKGGKTAARPARIRLRRSGKNDTMEKEKENGGVLWTREISPSWN
ncbi:MAG: hypothetical protein II797_04660, partial [Clostridia bacterium]|nr:hypothetical protein [Clostridia bacterium]